jgi:hypothetical protein
MRDKEDGNSGADTTSTDENHARGTISHARGTTGNPIQVGGTDKKSDDPSGRDGEGDNETETVEAGE